MVKDNNKKRNWKEIKLAEPKKSFNKEPVGLRSTTNLLIGFFIVFFIGISLVAIIGLYDLIYERFVNGESILNFNHESTVEYNKPSPICPGKNITDAIAKNECELYRFMLIANNPDKKDYILKYFNCSCEALNGK